MKWTAAKATAVPNFVVVLLCLVSGAQPQRHAGKYAAMAPTNAYLMTRVAEIALARSAAPAGISGGAKILILGQHEYETAVAGTNGFTCLVERAWMSPFDSPEFWNPNMRGPICYNPAATRTVLPYTIQRTQLALAGVTNPQMLKRIQSAAARRELPSPAPGAMAYMLSRRSDLGDAVGAWVPHLMIYIPKAYPVEWGANLPGSPVVLNDEFTVMPEPETIVMVRVGNWSDGTPGPGPKR